MKKLIFPTLAVALAACTANPVLETAQSAPASKSQNIRKHAVPTQLLGQW